MAKLAPLPSLRLILLLVASVLTTQVASGNDATTKPIDPGLWKRMVEVDAHGATISDLVAKFEQEKFTALLKKPLLSVGVVRVRGSAMKWETDRPEPTTL